MAMELESLALEFAGVVAVVAGGANGLGVAIAKNLAEKGAQVYISGDIVERKQICALSNFHDGLCSVLPKNLSTEELLAEVAEREDNVHILVDDATDGWGLVFARADAFFDMLLSGSVDETDPSRIITIHSSAPSTGPWESREVGAENAKALAAEFSDECVVVNCIEPARNEMDLQTTVDMAISLCSQPSLSGNSGISCVDNELVSVPQHADPLPFLQAKL